MSTAADTQRETDLAQLRLLAIFHYVVGGMMLLFASFFLIHVVLGLVMIFAPEELSNRGHGQPPPLFLGVLFTLIGSFAVALGWTSAGLMIYSGRCLARHRRWMFSLVMAAICCCFVPIGTVLGVFTIIVLMRDSVQKLYRGN